MFHCEALQVLLPLVELLHQGANSELLVHFQHLGPCLSQVLLLQLPIPFNSGCHLVQPGAVLLSVLIFPSLWFSRIFSLAATSFSHSSSSCHRLEVDELSCHGFLP